MALTSKFAKQETPAARLVYYMDIPDDPIDAQAAARSFVEGSFDLKSPEFVPVHLARRLIELADPAKPFGRLEFLAAHQAEIQRLKEEKFAKSSSSSRRRESTGARARRPPIRGSRSRSRTTSRRSTRGKARARKRSPRRATSRRTT